MKTQSKFYEYLPQFVMGIAVVLFSSVGIAAIMSWRSASAESVGNGTAPHARTALSSKAIAPTAHKAQRRNKALANGTCAECGLIVSMDEASRHDDDFGIGEAGGMTEEAQGEKSVDPVKRYEIIVRMADGSSRVINSVGAANWRVGGRVIVIAGTFPPSP